MNLVNLSGRLVKDIEVRMTTTGMAVGSFTLAVSNDDKEKTSSFINCKAFGKTAELIEKYTTKGSRLLVTGKWKTGNYKNKDGQTIYTNDCIVNQIEFLEKKGESNNSSSGSLGSTSNINGSSFMDIPDDLSDEGLPFA